MTDFHHGTMSVDGGYGDWNHAGTFLISNNNGSIYHDGSTWGEKNEDGTKSVWHNGSIDHQGNIN